MFDESSDGHHEKAYEDFVSVVKRNLYDSTTALNS